jgi:putative polymerase
MNVAVTECVLILAVCFNGLLSIINGHGLTLERGHVVLAELAIYGAALGVIIFNADRRMLPWFLLTWYIVLNGLLLSLGNGSFNPKFTRDVLVIPVFIMLGMSYRRSSLLRPILILHTAVFLIAFIEAASPTLYSDIFQILKYYVNTRDFSSGSFWNKDSDLFVSATRPGERFFGFVDLHRVSSLFLEPVSLGNYCVIMAIFLVAYWNELTGPIKAYLCASTFLLLVACDGRLAASSILVIVVGMPLFRRLSSRWTFLYLPLILLVAEALVWSLNPDPTADNFAGRVAGSVRTLSETNVLGLLGLDSRMTDAAADSGISYFILSQSLVGVAAIWLTLSLAPRGYRVATRLYVHGILTFVPLNLMVSFSFFSIKVAALMWFLYGYFFMQDDLENMPGHDIGTVPGMTEAAVQNGTSGQLRGWL